MSIAAALVFAAAAVPQPGIAVTAEARAEIVRAETLTAASADAPRGEEARVHRDEKGTAWVEFV